MASKEPQREFKPGLVLGTDQRRREQHEKQASRREAKKRQVRGQTLVAGDFETLLHSIRDVQGLYRVLMHNRGKSARDYYGVLFESRSTMQGIIELLQTGSMEALEMVLSISSHPMHCWSRLLVSHGAVAALIHWLRNNGPAPDYAIESLGNILCSCPEAKDECAERGMQNVVWAGSSDAIIYLARFAPIEGVWERLIRPYPLTQDGLRALRAMCNANYEFIQHIIEEPRILAQLPGMLPESLTLYDVLCESQASHPHLVAYNLDHVFLSLLEPGRLPLDQANLAVMALGRLYDVEQLFLSRCPREAPAILVGAHERLRLSAIRTRLVIMLLNMLRYAIKYGVKECMEAILEANALDVFFAVLKRDNGTVDHVVSFTINALRDARRFSLMDEAIRSHSRFPGALEALSMCPHPDLSELAEAMLREMGN